ncbi:hypothetical protein R84B8_02410 [Treponema sp. R8-4-B8]
MNFIKIKILSTDGRGENELLVNTDKIGAICVKYNKIFSNDEKLKKYGEIYEVGGLPKFQDGIVLMSSNLLSDLKKKLGVDIPINKF